MKKLQQIFKLDFNAYLGKNQVLAIYLNENGHECGAVIITKDGRLTTLDEEHYWEEVEEWGYPKVDNEYLRDRKIEEILKQNDIQSI